MQIILNTSAGKGVAADMFSLQWRFKIHNCCQCSCLRAACLVCHKLGFRMSRLGRWGR